jgi:hypothetical protein
VSLDILNFIEEEQVYIHSSSFAIDRHIQRISTNLSSKKKEGSLD